MHRVFPDANFCKFPGRRMLPDRVMRAIDMPLIDQRGPEFAKLAKRVFEGIKTIFKTTQPVIIYTATGTGAWEAALVNTLSPGDRVLMVETGQFATLWKVMAERLGLKPEFIKTDWRVGADPKIIEEHLRKDKAHEIKAVCVLHNETATGCLSPIDQIRKAIDAAGHPALFLVDTISSLASTDYRHDEWGVDVTIGGAQKGLMMPPGMSFNAVSEKALARVEDGEAAAVVLSMGRHADDGQAGFLSLHAGDADAVRPRYRDRDAARGRPRQRVCPARPIGRSDPPRRARVGTGSALPRSRSTIRRRSPRCCCPTATMPINSAMSRSTPSTLPTARASARYAKKYFRIGHMGDINDATLIGALAATEMALAVAGVPHKKGGVQAAMDYIVSARLRRRAGGGGVAASASGTAATWSLNA